MLIRHGRQDIVIVFFNFLILNMLKQSPSEEISKITVFNITKISYLLKKTDFRDLRKRLAFDISVLLQNLLNRKI